MGDVFPEIRARQKHVEEVLKREEEAFNGRWIRASAFQEAVQSCAVDDMPLLKGRRLRYDRLQWMSILRRSFEADG